MTVSVVLEHLLISLGAWVVGGTLGGAVGILIAIRARALFNAAPHLRRLSTLVPGRTVALNLLILAWTPASVVLVGLGPASDLLNAGLVMFVFTLLFTVSLLLEEWCPSPLAVRSIAGLRTLATLSLVATVYVADFNGIGWYMSSDLMTLHYDKFLQEWLVLAGLILTLDVLLGIVQLVVADHIGKRKQLHFVTQQS